MAKRLGDQHEEADRSRAERLERLAYDEKLVAALRLDGFTGPSWEKFIEVLVTYALPCMVAWIRSGQISQLCREKGVGVPAGFARQQLHEEDAKQLAHDAVADAFVGFKKVLEQDRWSATGGASLKTFFMGRCLTRFPNVCRAWLRDQRKWVPLSDVDDQSIQYNSVAHQIDPAEAAVAAVELKEVAGQLDERTVRAVILQDMGHKIAEIAELLEETPKTVEMILYRHRRRMRDKEG
jgi:RNA polymerase sigma factor (sigma-70 family)